jgi:FAD:protein FMN transferase
VTASVCFPALGTTASLVVADGATLARGRALLSRQLEEVDRACSRFRPDSELSRVNAQPGRPVRIGPLLAAAVRAALAAADASEGRVLPTLGAPLAAIGYDRTFKLVQDRLPEVRAVAPAPFAWREIRLDEAAGELTIPPGTMLDLGATAKALAADRAATAIAATTGSGVLVSLGGDIAVAGDAPAEGWPVLIAESHASPLTAPGPVVSIAGGGVATSSIAVRRWRTRRGEMHHILDPRTGRPAETPWVTVSVAAESCLAANVAATCSIVAGHEATRWLLERELPARLVASQGTVTYVGGWPRDTQAVA